MKENHSNQNTQSSQEQVLGKRLYYLLGISLVLGIGAAVYTLIEYSSATKAYDRLINVDAKRRADARVLEVDFIGQVNAYKSVILRGKKPELYERWTNTFHTCEAKVAKGLAALRAAEPPGTKIGDTIKKVEELMAPFNKSMNNALVYYVEHEKDTFATDALVQGASDPLLVLIDQIVDEYTNRVAANSALQTRIVSRSEAIVTAVLVIVGVVGAMLFRYLRGFLAQFRSLVEAQTAARHEMEKQKNEIEKQNRRLEDQIRELLNIVSAASDGDLTVRAAVSEGAMGNVADAINLMMENVGDLLKEVQVAANRVASAATEIQASSEQLAQGSLKQTGEIINTTTAVQEMAANIESVSNNATSASEAATRARQAAETGAKAVQQVIEGMERIRQNVQAGAKKIKRLGERSMEISTIINTISQISAQTDMLALNAAIEAARAGEHGRGFTVVAEEVRKLAERTASATKEIEKLIAGIQAETNESVSAMEQQTTEVESESKVVAGTGNELTRIGESSVQSAELINEINLAAKQQVRGATGVVKAMETVSAIAQQAQAGANQTKRATESLANLSSDLLTSLGKFKITTNGAH